MTQDIYSIIADLEYAEVEVAILRFTESYMKHKWNVRLTKNDAGTKGEINESGNDLIDTLQKAKKRFDLLLGKGFVAAAGTLLEAPKKELAPFNASSPDDDIPF